MLEVLELPAMSQIYCILDYETRSPVDLKKTGAHDYAAHSDTEIICAAWRIGTKKQLRKAPIHSWCPINDHFGEQNPNLFRLAFALENPEIKIIAHNAAFERDITKFVLSRYIGALHFEKRAPRVWDLPASKWICTAARARALALPASLEGACAALNLPVQKDMDGRRLILKYCKPRKATKNNSDKWHQDPKDFERIVEYCKRDVEAETELFLATPPLIPSEQKIWELDQKINDYGLRVDRDLVTKCLSLIAEETKNLDDAVDSLTFGAVRSAKQRDATLKELKEMGVSADNLRANTVQNLLKDPLLNEHARALLTARADVSKSSTAKFAAFEMRSRFNGRSHGNLVYHAASTGRWGGSGVQPQNLPRPVIENTDFLAETILTEDLEMIRAIYGRPMEAFSSVLRSCIIPGRVNKFYCADYAAIEARGNAWVSGDVLQLTAFRNNEPIYEKMATLIYGRTITKSDKVERFVGKTAELAAGYGMGSDKFKATCASAGVIISDELAEKTIKLYRELHAPIVASWRNLENAAIEAVKTGEVVSTNKTKWFTKNNFLFCELPSGRRLAYYGPEIRKEKNIWREKRIKKLFEQLKTVPDSESELRQKKTTEILSLKSSIRERPFVWRETLYHWGVDPLTKKWVCAGTYGGKISENVVSGICRDIMAEAMVRIDQAGYNIVLSVHDEILAETKKDFGDLKEFENLMSRNPKWAEGLPISVEGWTGTRYRK